MLGSNPNSSALTKASGTGGAVLKSGWNPSSPVELAQGARGTFTRSLPLTKAECTEANFEKYSNEAGQMAGLNLIAKKVSKQKLDTARGALGVYNTALQHHMAATNLELQWQQSTKRFAQGMASPLLDMKGEQKHHDGFSHYVQVADSVVNF